MSLRLRLNLAILALTLAFTGALATLQVEATRRSVREEVQASNRVAAQLLQRLGRLYALGGHGALVDFLTGLGRVRANELTLFEADGRVIYRSPASAYRPGEQAPRWFAAMVTPEIQPRDILLDGATLRIAPDASRAVLDGWDDVRLLLGVGAAFSLLSVGAVAALVSRATAPFGQIERALVELERGDWSVRLAPVRGREAARIRDAFNRMAAAVPGQMAARAAEAAAREQLAAARAFGERLQAGIEQERAQLARELHDEFGQAVTAIRSLATAIGRRADNDPAVSQAAGMIAETAAASYAAMQQLIGRLRPMALDTLGLSAALEDLVTRLQSQPGAPAIGLRVEGGTDALSPAVSLAAYRIVQEALANALRHARAARVQVALHAGPAGVRVRIDDDGQGMQASQADDPDGRLRGGFGLTSMRERAEALGGTLAVGAAEGGGTRIEAWLPAATQPAVARRDAAVRDAAP